MFDFFKLCIPEFVTFVSRLECFLICSITLNSTCVSAMAWIFDVASASSARSVVRLSYT